MAQLIGGKYVLGRKIGAGSFGTVHAGTHAETGFEVAMKLEPVKSKNPQLIFEAKLYKHLAGGVGVPRVYWYGVVGDFNVLVMDLLGPSLEDLHSYCKGRLSLNTVRMLADQMIERAEFLHSRHFLHRDIKPDNFLIGVNQKSSRVYMIDFGCAKRYIDPKTHRHIPYREGKPMMGTARYASVNVHLGLEQGRRDDLEALGYVLVYLTCGSLPWQGLQIDSMAEKYAKITELKQNIPAAALCKHLPGEFATYLSYCRGLQFEEKPDYRYLRTLLRDGFLHESCRNGVGFAWTSPETPLRDDTPRGCLNKKHEHQRGVHPSIASMKAGDL